MKKPLLNKFQRWEIRELNTLNTVMLKFYLARKKLQREIKRTFISLRK